MLFSPKEIGVFIPQCTAGASALGTKYGFQGYNFYLAAGKIERSGYLDVLALAIQDLSLTPANNTYTWLESFVRSRSNTPLLYLVKSTPSWKTT